MQLSIQNLALGALALTSSAQSARILVGNDDGWAAANLRETYRLLKAAGHDVILVAPVVDNSGQGGRAVFTNLRTLAGPGEFDSIPVGAPSIGQDVNDSHIWYYNGTPAACTFVGLDYVAPRIWGPNVEPDLFVSGPNVGTNLGPFLFTLSGTIGSTYAAVGRGIPGIAVSAASNGGQRGYKSVVNNGTVPDVATLAANITVQLVQQLLKNTKKGERVLPLGYGLNVNYPPFASFSNNSCTVPTLIQSRLTGGAFTDSAVYNATTGLFNYANNAAAGVNTCINGDCDLPGETTINNNGKCQAPVSVWTVDYDAPDNGAYHKIQHQLEPLVKYESDLKQNSKRELEMVAREVYESKAPRRHE